MDLDLNVYAWLTPAILGLVFAEFLYCLRKDNGYYNFQDSMANMATAIGHQVTNVFVAWAVFVSYQRVYEHHAVWRLEHSALNVLGLFIGIDFLFYWFHRAGHSINFLWAAHAPHHSSEELNYTVGLRASVTQRAASFLFYLPLAVLGYEPRTLLPAVGFHLVLQLIPHTRVIRRLPSWFEAVFNAPAHHRVHHAINDRYLGKNYGGSLIIWDKLFGTYEPEAEPAVYGVLRPLRSWDPVKANLQYWTLLWQDAVDAERWLDKLRLWFMPLGWRPRGARPRGPVTPAASQVKYQTEVPPGVRVYLLTQLIPMSAVMLAVTHNDSPLRAWQKAVLGALVWAAMIAWGGLLEGKAWAPRLELAKIPVLSLACGAFFGPGAGLLALVSGLPLIVLESAPWRRPCSIRRP